MWISFPASTSRDRDIYPYSAHYCCIQGVCGVYYISVLSLIQSISKYRTSFSLLIHCAGIKAYCRASAKHATKEEAASAAKYHAHFDLANQGAEFVPYDVFFHGRLNLSPSATCTLQQDWRPAQIWNSSSTTVNTWGFLLAHRPLCTFP